MASRLDLAAVDGLLQDVLDQGFPLIEELVLHRVVERGVARHLDEHGADGAGVLRASAGRSLRPAAADRRAACRYPAATATWRTPSMKAANTNSAFVGQRRYTVALLARGGGSDRVQPSTGHSRVAAAAAASPRAIRFHAATTATLSAARSAVRGIGKP